MTAVFLIIGALLAALFVAQQIVHYVEARRTGNRYRFARKGLATLLVGVLFILAAFFLT